MVLFILYVYDFTALCGNPYFSGIGWAYLGLLIWLIYSNHIDKFSQKILNAPIFQRMLYYCIQAENQICRFFVLHAFVIFYVIAGCLSPAAV